MKDFQFNPGNYFIVVIKVMSIKTVQAVNCRIKTHVMSCSNKDRTN